MIWKFLIKVRGNGAKIINLFDSFLIPIDKPVGSFQLEGRRYTSIWRVRGGPLQIHINILLIANKENEKKGYFTPAHLRKSILQYLGVY